MKDLCKQFELYGLALAAILENDDRHVKLICTPIALSNADTKKIRIVDDLRCTLRFDSENINEGMTAFAQVTQLIEKLTKRQQAGLEAQGLPFSPVALDIGQDERFNPIQKKAFALAMSLFGKQYPLPSTDEEIDRRIDRLMFVGVNTSRKNRGLEPHKDSSQITGEDLRHISMPVYTFRRNAGKAFNRQIRELEAEAKSRRDGWLQEQAELPEGFKSACSKLPGLLDKCTLSWGSFFGVDTTLKSNSPQSGLDLQLIELKKRFDGGDPAAKSEIIKIAYQKGRSQGRHSTISYPNWIFTTDDHDFSTYKSSPELQKSFPSYSFYEWDPAFREAFFRGYGETLDVPYTQSMKLPMDQVNPPFVDPCADMIRDQFEVIQGIRAARQTRDNNVGKRNISLLCNAISQDEVQQKKTFTDMTSARKAIWPGGKPKTGEHVASGEWRELASRKPTAAQRDF
jgi:hypothetical protein